MRLLLVELIEDLRRPEIVKGLREQGLAVDGTDSVQEAIKMVYDDVYDCVIMPSESWDGGALDLIAEAREYGHSTSVLVIHDEDDGAERAELMTAGADDCITAPVDPDELSIRALRLARMALSPAECERITIGKVEMDLARHEVFLEGELVHVTPTGYAVMRYLMVNRHRAVPVQELIEHCWDREGQWSTNPVHSQVSRLRSAFKGYLEIDLVRGCGYRVREADPSRTRTPESVA